MRRFTLLLAVTLGLALFLMAGCTTTKDNQPQANPKKQEKPITQEQKEEKGAEKIKVTLYFPDEQVEKLVKETREVPKDNDPLGQIIIEELIKGSQQNPASRVIPEGARLLTMELKDGIAYVNWSKEYQENHWGGSTGDIMTTYAIVNSLTELPDIKGVQFLLEGNVEEAMLGHVDTSLPLKRDESLLK